MMDAPHLIKSRRLSRGDSLSTAGTQSPVLTYASSSTTRINSSGEATCAKKTIVGSDLVDWLLTASSQTPVRIHSRAQATSMWQVLFEDRVLLPAQAFLGDKNQDNVSSARIDGLCPCLTVDGSSCGCICTPASSLQGNHDTMRGCCCCSIQREEAKNDQQLNFEDKYALFKFWFDCEGREARSQFTMNERRIAVREFAHSLAILCQVAPDAHLRTILRKTPDDRTEEDISLIFDELIQIPALSELTASVKQELAHVISYEFHPKKGTVGKCVMLFL